jgi:16S rRNA (guanine966-N2)-methyltransferase
MADHGGLRILGGDLRGRLVPSPAGENVRPMAVRMRADFVNKLQHGAEPGIVGARWWDLFAGAGGFGLELLSRGAAHVTFVEIDRATAQRLSALLASWRVDPSRFTVLVRDAYTMAQPGDPLPDGVFMGPPYPLLAGLWSSNGIEATEDPSSNLTHPLALLISRVLIGAGHTDPVAVYVQHPLAAPDAAATDSHPAAETMADSALRSAPSHHARSRGVAGSRGPRRRRGEAEPATPPPGLAADTALTPFWIRTDLHGGSAVSFWMASPPSADGA